MFDTVYDKIQYCITGKNGDNLPKNWLMIRHYACEKLGTNE